MFKRQGTKRKGSFKGRSNGGFKRRKGFGSGRGFGVSSPFGPSISQFGPSKGLTDQAILYKTVGIPGRIGVKLRTSYSGNLVSTSGAFSAGIFAHINSLLDPAGSVGTIRAAGHLNWFGASVTSLDGLFTSYIVTAAKLTAWFHAAAANTVPVNVMIRFHPAVQPTSVTSTEFMGNPNAVQTTVGLPAGGQASRRLTLYRTIPMVAGESMATVGLDDSFAALSSAEPASLMECEVAQQSTDAATTTNLLYRVELTQWCILFGRKGASDA